MTIDISMIQLALKNSDLGKMFVNIISSTKGFHIMKSNETRRPDLLIFELGGDAEKEILFIQSLLDQDQIGEVFLTSEKTDPALLLKTLRIGAKEFFPLPLVAEEVKQALIRFEERKTRLPKKPTKSGQVISIVGSMGGVGVTTVSVNLAVSLVEMRSTQSVVLIDFNTLFGEIPLFLELTPKFHWGEITKNINRLDSTFLMNVLSKHHSGIYILPSPGYLNGHQAPTPEIIDRLLYHARSLFDFVIIDGGQSTSDGALKVLQMSNKVILVSLLSLPCLINTNKLLKSFTDLGYVEKQKISVIVNRHIKKSDISLEQAQSGIGKELFWIIPNDYKTTMSAINNGTPLSHIAPKSLIAQNFKALADRLMLPEGQKIKKRRFFRRK